MIGLEARMWAAAVCHVPCAAANTLPTSSLALGQGAGPLAGFLAHHVKMACADMRPKLCLWTTMLHGMPSACKPQ